jgi:hypothetical protein
MRTPLSSCYWLCRQWDPLEKRKKEKRQKTYNSGDSLVVTHPTTNPPIQGLCMAERTGCPFLLDLWSYVPGFDLNMNTLEW